MIIGNITDTKEVEKLNPAFEKAFNWIRENFSTAESLLAEKRIYIDEDRMYVNIDMVNLRTKEMQLLETHCQYIDIHVPISTTEVIGWKHKEELTTTSIPYDQVKDFAMHNEAPHAYYALNPGDFCIMYTTDAHAPIIGTGEILKFCLKIKVQ